MKAPLSNRSPDNVFNIRQSGLLASLEWNKKSAEQRIYIKSTSPQHPACARICCWKIKLMNKTSAHYNFKPQPTAGYVCFLLVCAEGFNSPAHISVPRHAMSMSQSPTHRHARDGIRLILDATKALNSFHARSSPWDIYSLSLYITYLCRARQRPWTL